MLVAVVMTLFLFMSTAPTFLLDVDVFAILTAKSYNCPVCLTV